MSQMRLIARGRQLLRVTDFSEPASAPLPGKSSSHTRTMASKAITMENVNPNIVQLEYAVRGPLVMRATEIAKELEKVRFLT